MSPELEYILEALGKGFTLLLAIGLVAFVIARLIHSLSKRKNDVDSNAGKRY